jgi:hypothetical protein
LGHISKAVIEEKFALDCDQVVDSALAITCNDHNRPATFFSSKLNSWRCFECMLNQEGLIYIDKQYKNDMEDYE